MAIFDKLRQDIKNRKIDKARERRIKEEKEKQERREKEEKEKQERRELLNKIQEQYLLLEPVNNADIIGMRLLGSRFIEFLCLNETKLYMGREDYCCILLSGREIDNMAVAQDQLEDVCEALSCFIPRFADASLSDHNHFYFEGNKARYIYDVDDVKFDGKYTNKFADKRAFEKYNSVQKNKVISVIRAWSNIQVLQVVGREAYDEWSKVIRARKSFISIETSNKNENQISLNFGHAYYSTNDAKIIAGEEGEADVRYALSWLPKEFRIIQGDQTHKIYIKNDAFRDEKQEFDHIVIGTNGLFLIETKNYGGKISIDSDGNWTQEKSDGNPTGVRNPEQQVFQHEKLIRSIVKSSVPVISIICIANDRTTIDGISNSKIPIVKSDRIASYIENYKSGCNLTEELIEECYRQIQKFIIEDTNIDKRRTLNHEQRKQIDYNTQTTCNGASHDYTYYSPKDTSSCKTVSSDVQV